MAVPMVRSNCSFKSQTIKAIETFIRSSFPIRSDEYPEGSVKRLEYVDALEKLLETFCVSGNVDLFRVSHCFNH